MNIEDLKITIFNGTALLLSFSNVEDILKIILLSASIVYTILKINDLRKSNKKD